MGRIKYYVYILRNKSGTFYIGITSNLLKRVWEHKHKLIDGFTKKYNIGMLVYVETYDDPTTAIKREKQLKSWSRKKKIMLITKMNPRFQEFDLESLV